MPLSNKERSARFRALKNADPLTREEFLAKKRERYCFVIEKQSKKCSSIKEKLK